MTPGDDDRTQERLRRQAASSARQLLLVAVALIAVGTAVGWVVRWTEATPVGDLDRAIGDWFVDQRRSPWVGLSQGAKVAGDFIGVVGVVVLAAGLAAARWRRGREAVLVGAALALQVACFLAISALVQRPRPPVAALDDPPPTSAFPSGHAASAAMLWLTIALLVFAATRRHWVRVLSLAAAVLVPGAIAAGRLLRGAHALTDVLAGLTLGVVVVAAVLWVARRHDWAPGG